MKKVLLIGTWIIVLGLAGCFYDFNDHDRYGNDHDRYGNDRDRYEQDRDRHNQNRGRDYEHRDRDNQDYRNYR